MPELAGRFDGVAVRAPIPVGSVADIVFVAGRPTTPGELNDAFRREAATARYAGILGVSEDPLVSWGFTHQMIREAENILGSSA